MKKIKLYDENGIITQEALSKLEAHGASVSCECPRHLVDILKLVQEFTEYQKNCLQEKPQDKATHDWLLSSSKSMEHFISGTIVNLARLEGLIDGENNILDNSN